MMVMTMSLVTLPPLPLLPTRCHRGMAARNKEVTLLLTWHPIVSTAAPAMVTTRAFFACAHTVAAVNAVAVAGSRGGYLVTGAAAVTAGSHNRTA